MKIKYNDGQPCNHKGCLSHISHPCEGCGRIGGKGIIYYDNLNSEEYFYFEWLIIEKQITSEIYSSLSEKEIRDLINEYIIFKNNNKRYFL
jgi:hypothetical protein